MKFLLASEVNNSGVITSHSTGDTQFWKSILPPIGIQLFSFEDQAANNKLKEVVQQVFSTGIPTQCSLTIHNHPLQCTALRHSTDTVYICWETETENTPSPPTFINESIVAVESTQNKISITTPSSSDSILKRVTDNLPFVIFEIFIYPDASFQLGFVNKEFLTSLPGQSTIAVNENNNLLFDNVHPDDKQMVIDSVKNIYKSNIWDIEYRIIKKGETRWIKGLGQPEPKNNKDNYITVCGYLHDITKEKNDTAALSKERTLLRTLIDNLPVSIFVKDINGRKLIANKLDVEYMLLNNEQEALGKTDLDIFGNLQGKTGYAEDMDVIKTNKTLIDKEGQLIYKDGTSRDILVSKVPLKDDNGKTIGLLGICTDTTKLKKLEQRLEIVNYSFKKANVSILITKKDGSFFDVNELACTSLGYTKDEMMNLTIFDINPFLHKDLWTLHWEDIDNSSGRSILTNHKKKDGSLIDVEVNLNSLQYQDQILHCSFVIDITEKNKLNERLKLVEHSFRSAELPMYFLTKNGAVYDYNEAVCIILGYTQDEFSNLTIFDISTRHTPPTWVTRWEEMKAGQTQSVSTKIRKKDNTLLDVEMKTNLFEFGGIELAFTSFIDVTEKRKLEQELKLVEYAFTHSATPMHFLKSDGSIYDCNTAAHTLLGYTKDEYKTLTVFNLNKNITPVIFKGIWESLTSDSNKIYQFDLTKKNNTITTVEVRTNRIIYGDIELMISSFYDITEKIEKDKQLKLVDYAFRKASIANHFLYKDGRMFDFNDAACKLLGYSREEFKNLTVFDFSLRHNSESWKERWEELKNSNGNANYTTKLRKKDNTIIDVEVRADILQFAGMELSFTSMVDITERKKIEQDLIKSNERYENATIATSDAIFEVDFQNNSVFLSKNYYALLGYDHYNIKDLTNNDWTQHIHPEDLPRITESITKVIAGEGAKWQNEYRLRKADGNYIIVLDRGFAVRDKDNKVVKIVGAIQDITKRTQEEERLRLLEKVVTETTQSIIITDATEGMDTPIIYANDSFTRITGYTLDEVKGKNPRILHNAMKTSDDEGRNIMRNAIKNLLRWKVEIINVRKNGEQYWAEASGFPVFDKNKGKYTHWVAIQTDITSRKNAEEALAKSNERYENATIATSDVVWEWDLPTDSNYLSKNFTTLFGHPVNGLQYGENNNWRHNLHPEDKEWVLAKETEAANGRLDKWESEYRLRKANGEYAIVLDRGFCLKDKNGKVLRLVGAIQDITKKKVEEERLLLLEKVVTETTESIIIADATEGLDTPIVYTNEAFTKITGYPLEEVKGHNPRFLHKDLDITNDDGRNIMRNAIKHFLPWKVEVINTKKNGEHYWAEIVGFPVANEKGIYTNWVSIQTNITQRKEAEREKENLLNELMENNKELTQFSYITTHNFRAPLTNLVAICNRIDKTKIEDSMTKQLIEGFKQSTMLLNDTLNDLINILIIKENRHLETNKLHFADILDNVKNSISTILVKNVVKIEADFSENSSVNFSDVYLESIFLNLLTNSIKYAHPTRYPIIKIKTYKDAIGNSKLIYSDNGIGMNMERVKNKIFGLYQRFHNNPDGKGIGLYLVHSQITALGGQIEVESKEGVGTTFIITFK